MMQFSRASILLAVLLSHAANVPAEPAGFPQDCQDRMARSIRHWQPAPGRVVPTGVPFESRNAAATIGDFDGDGQPDLVMLGTKDEGRAVIAVCFSNSGQMRVHTLGGQLACIDSVDTVPAGSHVRDAYGKDRDFRTDSFTTSCSTTSQRRVFIYDRDQGFFDSIPL